MPSLVTVLASPSNYTASLSVRTDIPSNNSDGGGGGGGTNAAGSMLPNFLPETFDLPATFSPPGVGNLLASSSNAVYYEEKSFEFFEDAAEFFNSPLPFDASENGLFNGRFVPPPPRPPFLMDEPVLSDGLTTCDLCSWAMPTKSTFIFEGTIEKASELGWPLTLIIVSILSAILGAIIMITVVRCKRLRLYESKKHNQEEETMTFIRKLAKLKKREMIRIERISIKKEMKKRMHCRIESKQSLNQEKNHRTIEMVSARNPNNILHFHQFIGFPSTIIIIRIIISPLLLLLLLVFLLPIILPHDLYHHHHLQ